MKSFACMFFIFLFSTQASATEPFIVECEENEKARRYDITNGLTMGGEKIPDPEGGWMTEKWWGKDLIAWGGGEELGSRCLMNQAFSAKRAASRNSGLAYWSHTVRTA